MDEMSASKQSNSPVLQVSWLRHSTPIPQLLAVNNITNTPDPRYKALVSGGWSEFLLVIKDARPRDTSQYECQVSGPRHSSLHKFITLTVIGENMHSCTMSVMGYSREKRIHVCKVTGNLSRP